MKIYIIVFGIILWGIYDMPIETNRVQPDTPLIDGKTNVGNFIVYDDLTVHGTVSAYNQAPTDAVIYNRTGGMPEIIQMPNDWRKYDGLIAVLDCNLVGREFHLIMPDGRVFWMLAFDCAGIADGGYDWMIANGIVCEVDWYFWQTHPNVVFNQATLKLIK